MSLLQPSSDMAGSPTNAHHYDTVQADYELLFLTLRSSILVSKSQVNGYRRHDSGESPVFSDSRQ
jgi:hypothetical protein